MEAFANWYVSKIGTAPSPADSGTTLTVLDNPTVAPFDLQVPFTLVVWPANIARPSYSNAEIIKVGAAAGASLSFLSRAIEGSTARTILVGDQVAQLITAGMLAESTSGYYFEYDLALAAPHILNAVGSVFAKSVPVLPLTRGLGNETEYTNLGRMTFSPGVIATFSSLDISRIDTRFDSFDYSFNILVTDDTGANQLVVGYTGVVSGTGVNDLSSKTGSDLSTITTVGTDLSYNPATGEISSVAGGLYEISTYIPTYWD